MRWGRDFDLNALPEYKQKIVAFMESHDPETGALQWKWWVTPEPGQPGSETWTDPETMMKGGGFPWLTGTYDPELNLYYSGTGNGGQRRSDHLFDLSPFQS